MRYNTQINLPWTRPTSNGDLVVGHDNQGAPEQVMPRDAVLAILNDSEHKEDGYLGYAITPAKRLPPYLMP